MKFVSNGITWKDKMKEHAEKNLLKQFSKTEFNFDNCEIKVSIMNDSKRNIKVEISGNGFVAQEVGGDFYKTFNLVSSKLKDMFIKKSKKQLSKRRKQVDPTGIIEDDIDNDDVVKEKIFIITPQTIDCAIDSFNQTDYKFYIFNDIDHNCKISVLYRRSDGKIGVIRCVD